MAPPPAAVATARLVRAADCGAIECCERPEGGAGLMSVSGAPRFWPVRSIICNHKAQGQPKAVDLPQWEASFDRRNGTNRRSVVTAFGILVHAIKAIALVVLLSLGWAMPVQAHSGHARPHAVAPAAKVASQDARPTIASASPAADVADICTPSTPGVSGPMGDCPKTGGAGRSCCGTMCTAAVIEHAIASLPLRVFHRIRLGLPPERTSPVRAPSLDARPPRTFDIA